MRNSVVGCNILTTTTSSVKLRQVRSLGCYFKHQLSQRHLTKKAHSNTAKKLIAPMRVITSSSMMTQELTVRPKVSIVSKRASREHVGRDTHSSQSKPAMISTQSRIQRVEQECSS